MATETWVLVNHAFRLPLAVSWDSPNIAKVVLHPGIHWFECWKKAAAEMLANIVFSEHEQAWFIFSQWLARVAVQVDTEDIESLVVWHPERPPIGLPAGDMKQMGPKRMKRATEIREFLQWFVDSSGIKLFERIEELETFYYMLMGSGLLYMLETGKAMPLTWARVFAAPTKEGWKLRAHSAGKGMGGKRFPHLMETVAQYVYCSSSRPFDKENKMEWLRPEIIWDDAWRETWLANEKTFQAENTDAAYVRMCRDRIKKTLPLLLEAYVAYRKEKGLSSWSDSRPDVIIRPRTGTSFRKHRTPEEVAAAKAEWACRLGGRDKKKEYIILSTMGSEAKVVPPVPDILREGQDVWDEDGDFLEPDYDKP